MKLPSKRQLTSKFYFEEKQFLYLLLTDKRFRWAIVLCFLLITGTIVSLLKIWPSTPRSTTKQLRISLVDWVQAMSMARSARHWVKHENLSRAISSWRSAIGNHPGSKRHNREYLRALTLLDQGQDHWKDAVQTARWLVEISPNNVTDFELALDVLESYRLDGYAWSLFETNPTLSSPAITGSRLRILFRRGQFDEFESLWTNTPTEIRDEPLVQLYRATFNKLRGGPAVAKSANGRLLEAVNTLDYESIASRLLLYTDFVMEDTALYGKNLELLSNAFVAQPIDHVRYWKLLTRKGQATLAKWSAIQYNPRPRTHEEVMQLADGYATVGFPDLAIRLIEANRPEFGFKERDWLAQTDLLEEQEKWNELNQTARTIRSKFGISKKFLVYSFFLQGLSEHRRQRSVSAIEAFTQILNYNIEDPELGLSIGTRIFKLGYGAQALEIIDGLCGHYQQNLAFWDLLFEVAMAEQSTKHILLAAENLNRLQPSNYIYKTNLSAVLTSLGIRREEAFQLTSEAIKIAPQATFVHINHAHALVRQERFEEAKKFLSPISPSTLNQHDRQGFYLAVAELYYRLENWTLAKKAAGFVNPKSLLRGDHEMLKQLLIAAPPEA